MPLLNGKETEGANSIAVWIKSRKLPLNVVVGWDFSNPLFNEKNCAFSDDGGKTWKLPESPPHGYRSCVEFLTAKRLIACGLTGVDISEDSGLNWKNISGTGFHVCRKAKKGKAVFFSGLRENR